VAQWVAPERVPSADPETDATEPTELGNTELTWLVGSELTGTGGKSTRVLPAV
jgi:hypothetical protein